MIRLTPVTRSLLIAIAVVWGAELLNGHVIDAGANLPLRELHGQYWRFVTSMFLHGGWAHVLLNAFSLLQLGSLFESLFGRKRFLLVYFATGIVASVASSMAGHVSVGASGAIFGVAGATITSILRTPHLRQERWLRRVTTQLVVVIAANLYAATYFPNVDNTAHIGGLIAGLLLGVWKPAVPPPPPSQQTIDV